MSKFTTVPSNQVQSIQQTFKCYIMCSTQLPGSCDCSIGVQNRQSISWPLPPCFHKTKKLQQTFKAVLFLLNETKKLQQTFKAVLFLLNETKKLQQTFKAVLLLLTTSTVSCCCQEHEREPRYYCQKTLNNQVTADNSLVHHSKELAFSEFSKHYGKKGPSLSVSAKDATRRMQKW